MNTEHVLYYIIQLASHYRQFGGKRHCFAPSHRSTWYFVESPSRAFACVEDWFCPTKKMKSMEDVDIKI